MRCFAEPGRWSGDAVTLDPGESHHLVDVLRAGRGAEVDVFDGRGRAAAAVLETAEPRAARLRVTAVDTEPRPAPERILVAALPKGDRADWICQKAVELGCAAIRWVEMRHSVVRLSGARAERRMQRFRAVAVSAAKQSGVRWIPDLAWYPSVAALLAARPPAEGWLVCHVGAGPRVSLREGLARLRRDAPRAVAVCIGPEGDFSGEEVGALLGAGATAVDLGPRVLRTETAALFAMAVLAYEGESPAAADG